MGWELEVHIKLQNMGNSVISRSRKSKNKKEYVCSKYIPRTSESQISECFAKKINIIRFPEIIKENIAQ